MVVGSHHQRCALGIRSRRHDTCDLAFVLKALVHVKHLRGTCRTNATITFQCTHHKGRDRRATLGCVGHGFQSGLGGLTILRRNKCQTIHVFAVLG